MRKVWLAIGTTGTQPPMTATTIRDWDRMELPGPNKESHYLRLNEATSEERRRP